MTAVCITKAAVGILLLKQPLQALLDLPSQPGTVHRLRKRRFLLGPSEPAATTVRSEQFPLDDRQRADRGGGGKCGGRKPADPMAVRRPRRQELRANLFVGGL